MAMNVTANKMLNISIAADLIFFPCIVIPNIVINIKPKIQLFLFRESLVKPTTSSSSAKPENLVIGPAPGVAIKFTGSVYRPSAVSIKSGEAIVLRVITGDSGR